MDSCLTRAGGGLGWVMAADGYRISFGDNENILKLDDDHTTLCYCIL